MTVALPSAATESDPVTVVNTRLVRPGREAEFEQWLVGIGRAAATFPGYIDRQIIRPQDHEHPEYVVVFRFDRYSSLKRWTESAERKAWLARVEPLVLDEMREHVLTGLERWFTLSARPELPPPPRYKMALVTLCVIYPLATALGAALAPVLSPLPAPLRSLVTSATLVVLMTYVVMPRVTRLFRFFLYPGA